jgi:UDP-glucose 4-epimerase
MGRILVTGATGFVGRQLVTTLLARGRRLTAVVRSADSCPLTWQRDQNVRLVETGPIELAANLESAFADVSTVIHAAGLAHLPRANRSGSDASYFAANAVATERLTKAAANSDVKKFIHLSSLAAITPNASTSVVDDNTRTHAITPYGRSKQEAELHVSELALGGICAISLRPPLIVGARAKGNWAALQSLAATGLPLPFASVVNRRALISVSSVVQILIHLADRPWPSSASGNYCLADAERLSLPEILSELRVGMGYTPRLFALPSAIIQRAAQIAHRPELVSGLLGTLDVDSSRFRTVFNYEQSNGLRDAIRVSGREYVQQRKIPDIEAISS